MKPLCFGLPWSSKIFAPKKEVMLDPFSAFRIFVHSQIPTDSVSIMDCEAMLQYLLQCVVRFLSCNVFRICRSSETSIPLPSWTEGPLHAF